MNSENLCPFPLALGPVNVRAQTADRNRDGPHRLVGFLYAPVGVACSIVSPPNVPVRRGGSRAAHGTGPDCRRTPGGTILGISNEIPKCC